MRILQYVIGILLFVVVGVFAVKQQVTVVHLGYQLHQTQQETERLREENRNLEARIAEKRNLKRLEEYAEQRLPHLMSPVEAAKRQKR